MYDPDICCKCGKDMSNPTGNTVIRGVSVRVQIGLDPTTQSDIAYNNKQLGKYSDGNGECDVSTCYECYIDALFGVPLNYLNRGGING